MTMSNITRSNITTFDTAMFCMAVPGMIGMFSATHPQESLQFDSGSGGGLGIKSIAGVYERAEFSAAGCGGHCREQQRGAAGRCRTANFRQATSRQTSSKRI